ncbi:hypothetical protein ILUMI_11345 [Ignelater luminosus]|uniref:Uncharacterized protein n=1 Tax=Ignelater luminosus TaxID=2038154 RepID=A0A8K0GAK9_IGNLU|nr:hypothetical protein ILUMI_11345 [Ignelater luminosus]
MTIEEQIIKSQSMASIPPEEITTDEADELDDIDKVRDDLQSTKQMLNLELRNKETLIRDNKRLVTRIQQLEAELDKEKVNKKPTPAVNAEADEKLMTSLKSEAADARKVAQELELKYHDAASLLDNTKSELEEVRKQKQALEKKLMESVQGGKRLSLSDKKDSIRESDDEEEELIESDSGGSDNEEKREKRVQRELKQLRSKLRSYKNKEDNAKKERMALKNQIKRLQQAMKEEKKKYKGLQKEVAKMDAMLKEVSGDSDEEEEEKEKKEEEEETETETETESESESSETDSESEKSMSEAEDAPHEKKKENLSTRTSKHEGRLSALKKGNYMLKTNVERLQDDLNKQKEESVTLQQELDSVLSELG